MQLASGIGVPDPGVTRRSFADGAFPPASLAPSVPNPASSADDRNVCGVNSGSRVKKGDHSALGLTAAGADRHTSRTAREPMCFSSHTTSATPSAR